jgi:chemotaxis protein MotB
VGSVLAEVPNRLTLEGHTDALPFGSTERGYSNWELSADRANASRRELLAGGLQEDHVLRVQGLAASNPFDRKDPAAPANRRISIIVMTRAAEDRLFRTAPEPEPEAEPPALPAAPRMPGAPAMPNSSPMAAPAEAPLRSSTAAGRR